MVWSLRFLGLIPAIFFISQSSTSALSDQVLISQVQTGGVVSASDEFVELSNPNNVVIDMRGWKLKYVTASGATEKVLLDFEFGIKANSSLLLVSDGLSAIDHDAVLKTSGLAELGGHIVLLNENGDEIDRLGWGDAVNSETKPAVKSTKGNAMWRKVDLNGILIDTDNNFEDFEVLPSDPSFGGLTEIVDEPINYPVVEISELLPNPGDVLDTEGEFIELHNSNELPVSLNKYVLQTGTDYQYSYVLPNVMIEKYLVLYANETGLVLSNTSSNVRLLDPIGKVISQTSYSGVDEDEAWALLNDWQVTNVPTPGESNEPSVVDEPEVVVIDEPEACPEGKYRNPATNRCKTIETEDSLKPCAENQVRNPLTNRCKLITSEISSLQACAENQYRNPETNRCKKIETDDGLKPCDEGQERNPETNRCKKVLGEKTDSNIEEPKQSSSKVSYFAFAGLGLGVLVYIAWEYRKDILAKLRKDKSSIIE